eukprot:g2543.t1
MMMRTKEATPPHDLANELRRWIENTMSTSKSERRHFVSDQIYLQTIAKEFVDLARAARNHRGRGKVQEAEEESTSTQLSTVVLAIACYLHRKFSEYRLASSLSTHRLESDVVRDFNDEIFRHIYAEDDIQKDAPSSSRGRRGDGGDRKPEGYCRGKRLGHPNNESSSRETTPLDFLSMTPYYVIVNELKTEIGRYVHEYDHFQLEFDEVKEMIERSHRVIQRALGRWENLYMKVSLRHWKQQVDQNKRERACRERFSKFVTRTFRRDTKDRHFQAWVAYVIDKKTNRAERELHETRQASKVESDRNATLMRQLYDVDTSIGRVHIAERAILEDNRELKAQLTLAYNANEAMADDYKKFFERRPHFPSSSAATREGEAVAVITPPRDTTKSRRTREMQAKTRRELARPWSRLDRKRFESIAEKYKYSVPVDNVEKTYEALSKWLEEAACELRDIFRHYAHRQDIRLKIDGFDGSADGKQHSKDSSSSRSNGRTRLGDLRATATASVIAPYPARSATPDGDDERVGIRKEAMAVDLIRGDQLESICIDSRLFGTRLTRRKMTSLAKASQEPLARGNEDEKRSRMRQTGKRAKSAKRSGKSNKKLKKVANLVRRVKSATHGMARSSVFYLERLAADSGGFGMQMLTPQQFVELLVRIAFEFASKAEGETPWAHLDAYEGEEEDGEETAEDTDDDDDDDNDSDVDVQKDGDDDDNGNGERKRKKKIRKKKSRRKGKKKRTRKKGRGAKLSRKAASGVQVDSDSSGAIADDATAASTTGRSKHGAPFKVKRGSLIIHHRKRNKRLSFRPINTRMSITPAAASALHRKNRRRMSNLVYLINEDGMTQDDEEAANGLQFERATVAPLMLQWLQYVCDDHIFLYAHSGAAQAFLSDTIRSIREISHIHDIVAMREWSRVRGIQRVAEDGDMRTILRTLFRQYADKAADQKHMCLSQFMTMVKAATSSSSSSSSQGPRNSRHLGREIVFRMFEYIQQRDTQHAHEEDHATVDDDRIMCSFDEFVLGVASCACYTFPNPYEAFETKLRSFVCGVLARAIAP